MHDAVRMSVGERVHDIAQRSHNIAYGKLMLPRKSGAQRFPGDERHGVKQQAVLRACRKQGDDMRMLQPRRELDLALEAIGAQPGGEIRRQNLDDDPSVEREIMHEEDTRHPPTTELPLDSIPLAKACFQPFLEVGNDFLRG